MSTPALAAAHAAATTAFAAGDDARVLALIEPLLDERALPDNALALAANAALRLDAPARAIGPMQALSYRYPRNEQIRRSLSMACNNHGARLLRDGDLPGAERAYAEAIAAWPDNAEALYNLSRILLQRRDAAALPLLQRLRDLKPGDDEVTVSAAEIALRRDGEDRDAWTGELEAIADPSLATRLYAIGETLGGQEAVPLARRVLAQAARLAAKTGAYPSVRARIASELLLPAVHADRAALDAARARYGEGLDALHTFADDGALAKAERSLDQLQWSNFLLAYQGEDDLALQSRYGDFLARALAQWRPDLLVAPTVPPRARPRIGLLSPGFRYCTVGSYFGPWIAALSAGGFETIVFALGPGFDAVTDALEQDADRLHRLDGTIESMADAVRAAELDLLIFPDVGMDARVQVLAACRLAPRQAAAWGHPVTTGLPTIDAYIGCGAMEPPDGAAHYRETLHVLPDLGTEYAAPAAPARRSRADLGLPEGPLYLVPQSSFKIHPDNDAVYAAIATSDPRATLLMFSSPALGADQALERRLRDALRHAGADGWNQLLVRPHVDRAAFLELAAACDVMVDTHHWSGGNATLDALRAGVPVVSVPGRFMRGRQSAAMLRQIDLADALVRADGTAQVKRAVEIANDAALRASLSTRIGEAMPTLLEGRRALAVLIDTVRVLLDTPAR